MDFQSENLMRKYLGLPPLAGGEEVSASFDGADAACTCACDAAPKKPQTLEQHLKQYHHGQMPKGDCSWLKQYKKDHPDWQKDAAKVSKGEAAVDTVKKDAPKGKKVSSAEYMKTEGFKKGSLVNYRMASEFSHDVWEITGLQPNGRITIKRVRDGMGRKVAKGIEIEVDATSCKRSSADAARADGKPAKADGGKGKADGGNGTKGEQKKSSAAEYLDAVKKNSSSNGEDGKKKDSSQSNNMMEWREDDPRWKNSGWGSYKNYHQKQDAFHEKFVKINAWSWAKESGIPQKTVEEAMRAAWKIAPYRQGFHGIDLYKSEMTRYIAAYRRELKRLTGKKDGAE